MRAQVLQVVLDDAPHRGGDGRVVALEVVELQQQALADVARGDPDRRDLLDQREDLLDQFERHVEIGGDRLGGAAEVAALVERLDQPLGDRDLVLLQQGAHVGEHLLVQARLGGDQRHRVEVVVGDAVGGLLGEDLGVVLVGLLGGLGLLADQAGRAEGAVDDAAADGAGLLVFHLQRRVGEHLVADDVLQLLAREAEDVVGLDQAGRDPGPHLGAHLHRGFHAHRHSPWARLPA